VALTERPALADDDEADAFVAAAPPPPVLGRHAVTSRRPRASALAREGALLKA
jgi:hypothetical protein